MQSWGKLPTPFFVGGGGICNVSGRAEPLTTLPVRWENKNNSFSLSLYCIIYIPIQVYEDLVLK